MQTEADCIAIATRHRQYSIIISTIMKIYSKGYWLFSLLLLCLAACSSGDESTPDTAHSEVTVKLNLSAEATDLQTSAARSTRHTAPRQEGKNTVADWADANATADELMHHCFVMVVQGGMIQHIIESADYQEPQSYVGTLTARIKTGQTTFYSFANMRPQDLGLAPNATLPAPLPDGFDQQYYGVRGNTTSTDSLAEGIPMSNKQVIDITEKTQQVDLEVIRMMAKVKLRIWNDTSADFKVKSISLSDITQNQDNNIALLPQTDGNQLAPAINPQTTKAVYTAQFGEGKTVKAGGTAATDFVFYVNESTARQPKYFVITLNTDQGHISKRMALTAWNEITRNDYLIIPVHLNDYRMAFEVEMFTAIGVLPNVETNDSMLTVRFHGYGDFHIKPHVYRISDGTELTPGTDSPNGWTLQGWSLLEAMPQGPDGTCIYDRSPWADGSKKLIEGTIGNRSGYALHELLFGIHGLDYQIPFKVQIIKE